MYTLLAIPIAIGTILVYTLFVLPSLLHPTILQYIILTIIRDMRMLGHGMVCT